MWGTVYSLGQKEMPRHFFLFNVAKTEVKIISNKFRVVINDILHLSVDLSELVGIQSYKYDDCRFCIDYYLKTTQIETWYTKEEEWKAILDGISKLSLV